MALANTEIVHEGWLVKSPPTKRIWRAKWRRRWFVLKHSGELPGQYFLEYYTDRTYRKLKGKIDLDQCEQVDSGLTIESRKQRFAHMFDIRTPKRVYFLAADNENDMNSWVGCICHVCGLKVFYREDEEPNNTVTLTRPVSSAASTTTIATTGTNATTRTLGQVGQLLEDTPPTSPTSPTGSSGPYFPLSECLSGSRSLFFHEVMASMSINQQPSSAPVTPAPTARGLGTQSLRNKASREDWDIFYDQPRQLAAPGQQQLAHSQHVVSRDRSHDDHAIHEAIRGFEEKFARSFKKPLPPAQNTLGKKPPAGQSFVPPPRPPKPPHLIDQPSHNYLNLEQLQSPLPIGVASLTGKPHSRSSSPRSPPSVSPPLQTPTNPDAWYDFPRSHQDNVQDKLEKEPQRRHNYSNAAPGEVPPSASATSASNNNVATAEVFTFNAAPPASSGSASAAPSIYSNLASPFPLASPSPALLPMTPFSPPPSVNRTLKPKLHGAAGQSEGVTPPPPSVNRQLKPNRPVSGVGPQAVETLGNSSDDAEDPSSRSSSRPDSAHDEEQIYYFLQGNQIVSRQLDEIQYLDLDLDSDSSLQSPKSPERIHHPSQLHHANASSTVYKTVDFVKTEAFNRTRLTAEERRSKKVQ